MLFVVILLNKFPHQSSKFCACLCETETSAFLLRFFKNETFSLFSSVINIHTYLWDTGSTGSHFRTEVLQNLWKNFVIIKHKSFHQFPLLYCHYNSYSLWIITITIFIFISIVVIFLSISIRIITVGITYVIYLWYFFSIWWYEFSVMVRVWHMFVELILFFFHSHVYWRK